MCYKMINFYHLFFNWHLLKLFIAENFSLILNNFYFILMYKCENIFINIFISDQIISSKYKQIQRNKNQINHLGFIVQNLSTSI